MASERVLGIDIGGTKLAAGLVDNLGELNRRREVPTQPNSAGDGEALWLTLATLINDVCDGETPAAIGIGCGGPMRWAEGLVSPLNLAAWRDFPLLARVRSRFPDRPVRLINDAIAMAVGEHWRGAGRGSPALLGVVVSTGVGGGLVLDDRVVAGRTGNAGHIGHVVVDPDGPVCGCGGHGCLEAVARGPAVVKWALDHGWAPDPAESVDGRTLLGDARAGNEVAVAAFARAGRALGVAVASAAHLLELDRVIVGGGLANAGELLLAPARAAFADHVTMRFAAGCEIVGSTLGGDAGLIGAAALVAAGDRYWVSGAH